MNKILIITSLVLLASCGLSQDEKENIAAITCAIMSETRNMDAAVRVRELNEAREKIGEEPFLNGDEQIRNAIEKGYCEGLVLNDKNANPDIRPTVKEEFYSNGKLKGRTELQAEIDGGKVHGVDEWYHENGKLWFRANFEYGEPVGVYEQYYDNGQLEIKANFIDGEKDGFEELYHENGQLNLEQITNMGTKMEFQSRTKKTANCCPRIAIKKVKQQICPTAKSNQYHPVKVGCFVIG